MPKTATRTPLLAAALLAGAAIAALSGAVPAAAAGVPPASQRPGYLAQAVCSENGVPAGSELFAPYGAMMYPAVAGHLNTCEEPGGTMTLRDEGSVDSEPLSGPGFSYQAPDGLLIAGGTMTFTMRSPGGEVSVWAPTGKEGDEDVLASCNTSCTNVHSVTVSIPNTESWGLLGSAICLAPSGQSKCPTTGVDAELSISTATILLHSEATPEASGVSGSLTESPVSGTGSISFTAHETHGPGIYRVIARVDGSEVIAKTPDTEDGRCVAYGSYEDALEFRHAQPCPAEVPVRLELPTGSYSDGPHLLEVSVEDAAGDRSVIFDRTLQFQNGAPASTPASPSGPGSSALSTPAVVAPAPVLGSANGSPVSEVATIGAHWAGTKAAMSATSRYGHARTIERRLTDPAGTPIVGALIEVSDRPAAVGASASAMASTRTSSDGSFSVRVPARQSVTVLLAYRSHLGDPAPAASANLTLAVPASVHLSVNPTVTNVGDKITLHGKLAGAIGTHGKQLILQARAPGGSWIEFHGAKAGAAGNFKVTHRFKLPGPVRYEFQVICEAEPAFPFARGVSNVVSVWER